MARQGNEDTMMRFLFPNGPLTRNDVGFVAYIVGIAVAASTIPAWGPRFLAIVVG